MSAPKTDRPAVSANALCKLFNLTPARIGQLVKAGVVTKLDRGKYDLWESVRGYIRFLQERRKPDEVASDTCEMSWKTRKERSDALKGEKYLEILESEYLPASVVSRQQAEIAHVCNALLRAVSSELPALCAGLSAPQIEKQAKAWSVAWARKLADADDAVWVEAEKEVANEMRGDMRKVAKAKRNTKCKAKR